MMRFVSPLNEAEIISLQWMSRDHPLCWPRTRANAVLLSDTTMPLQSIASLCGVCRQTASIGLKNWETKGVCGLLDKPGRGRRSKIWSDKEAEVMALVKASPRSFTQVLLEIQKRWGIELSRSTLKTLCKKSGLIWKRVRQSIRGKRDEKQFIEALEVTKDLMAQADKGDIDFYYFDESGFTWEPGVPDAWQEMGKTIEIPSSKSRRLNVLGFMSRECRFESHVFEGSVDSNGVMACFNEFAKHLNKKTVGLIDNAPPHTSPAFLNNIDPWEEQNLFIQNIPAYSPELNKIEILWRKIKDEWLNFSADESFKSLQEELSHILANIGLDYHINFT